MKTGKLFAAVGAASAVLVASAPAVAAPGAEDIAVLAYNHHMFTTDLSPGGELKFWYANDRIRLCDLDKAGDGEPGDGDGWHVWAKVGPRNDPFYKLSTRDWDRTCKTRSDNRPRFNLPERDQNDRYIRFEVCLRNADGRMGCNVSHWPTHR